MRTIMAISLALLMVLTLVLVVIGATPKKMVNSCIFTSSFTKTNETAGEIGNTTWLHTVVVSSASAGGYLRLFDRDGSTTNAEIGRVDLGTLNTYLFDVCLSSGLTYITNGNVGGVTITYR